MSEELRPCPFCGNEPVVEGNLVACNNLNCPTHDNYWTDPMIFTCDQWNTRPIEDALTTRIAKLEGFIGQLIEAGNDIALIANDILEFDGKSGEFTPIAEKWQALVKNRKEV